MAAPPAVPAATKPPAPLKVPSLTASEKRIVAGLWKKNEPRVDELVGYLLAKASEALVGASKSYEDGKVKFAAYLRAK